MVPRGKPAPDLFLYAADRMGYAPAACLVVEDSPAGISGGASRRHAGGGLHRGEPCQRPTAHRAEIAALAPDAVIDDIRALVSLCGAAPRA